MSIVKDKKFTMDFAHEVTKKLIDVVCQEGKVFNVDDDPAEHVYLILHVVGFFMSKMAMSLEGFAQIYGINGLTTEKSMEIMTDISKGQLNFVREHTDYFKNNNQVMQ